MTKPLCGAKKRQGEGTCRRPAGWGTDHPGHGKCKLHGGSTPNHKTAAVREAVTQEAEHLVAVAGVDQDPIEHLVESLHQTSALVRIWDAMVSGLDELLTFSAAHGAQLHPYVAERDQQIDRRAKFAKMCHDAGVSERQIQVTELQARVAHEAFEAAIASDPEAEKQRKRKIYANRLRSA